MSDTVLETLVIRVNSDTVSAENGLNRLLNTLSRFNVSTQASGSSVQASFEKVATAGEKGAKRIRNSFLKAATGAYIANATFKKVASIFGSWFNEANSYVEALNLFNVAMGDGAEKALKYARSVERIMGVDLKEWLSYQGGFNQLAEGYGIASEYANTMSQNLTQLAYDLSSLWNTDVKTAFQKLQSGMSGQIKGLKVWGINVSVAQIKETALAHGIDLATSKMTEAQKATLRYITIMEQTANAQGDLARTIATPANALRILNVQWTQAKRAMGQVISVVAVKVIPYFQALIQIIKETAQSLAKFFGYELPEIDYSDSINQGASSAEDFNDSLSDAVETSKELKRSLLGIDEINALTDNSAASSLGSTLGGGYDPTFGIDLDKYSYDFMSKVKMPDLEKYKEELYGVLDVVKYIAIAFASWKISSGIINSVETIQSMLKNKINKASKIAVGFTLMVTGLWLEWDGAYNIGNGTGNVWDYVKMALGSALAIGGSLLVFGTGPLGWTIGITAALAIGIAGITVGYNAKQLREDLEKRFGEISLTAEEVKEYAMKLTTSELSVKLDLYVDELETLSSIEKQLDDVISDLSRKNLRVSLGLTVSDSDYETSVNNFVDKAIEYIEQKQVVASLAIDIIYSDTSASSESLSQFVDDYYSGTSEKLNELGTRLKEVVAEGFKDGKWIEDSHAEAMKLQKEINEVINEVATAETNAKMKALLYDNQGKDDLTAESFKEVINKAEEIIKEQQENLEKARITVFAQAELKYNSDIKAGKSEKEARKAYDDTIKKAQEEFNKGKIKLDSKVFDFGMDTIESKYADELKKLEPILSKNTNQLFQDAVDSIKIAIPNDLWDKNSISKNIGVLTQSIKENFEQADISGYARENMDELIKELQPTIDDFNEIAESNRKAGKAVPKYVSEGLRTPNLIKALTGDVDALNYITGEHLSTSTTFLETLATAENAGKNITGEVANGLLNNLEIVENASNGTITLINDTIGEKTLSVTPTLVQNLKDLGINLSDGLKNGVDEQTKKNSSSIENSFNTVNTSAKNVFGKDNFVPYGESAADGIKDGIVKGMDKNRSAIESAFSFVGKKAHQSFLEQSFPDITAQVNQINKNNPLSPQYSIKFAKMYGSGGFPETGQMFIAREGAPELVGTIGNKSAVVNNEQIISGISEGVADANAEQNALLREQNNLLRKLLDKDYPVPNPYGGANSLVSEIQRKNRRDGKTVIPVGV
ncbi:MAG: hypothetical protein ACI4IS_02890 [Acutalibacteraceae bacterium]